jgi:hypothetical protein
MDRFKTFIKDLPMIPDYIGHHLDYLSSTTPMDFSRELNRYHYIRDVLRLEDKLAFHSAVDKYVLENFFGVKNLCGENVFIIRDVDPISMLNQVAQKCGSVPIWRNTADGMQVNFLEFTHTLSQKRGDLKLTKKLLAYELMYKLNFKKGNCPPTYAYVSF